MIGKSNESGDSRRKGAGCVTLRTPNSKLRTNKGVALVTALIVTLVVFLLIMSTLYMVITSTVVSGAGKRYATASEAADGAVEVMKEAINLIIYGESISTLPFVASTTGGLIDAITLLKRPTEVTLNLPGTGFLSKYVAKITVERLYSKNMPGGSLEFARSIGGAGSTAVYFKISTVVTDPKDNTKAETTALYRFVG